MKVILISTIILIVHSAIVAESGIFDRPTGTWSKLIEADESATDLPAQYYLCGFQFQSLKWSRAMECQCHNRFYRWKYQRRCQTCIVDYETKTAGLRAVFCRNNNWNDQISKIYDTGSSSAGQWRNTSMCPVDHYATGFSVRLANQFGTDLGLDGLKLRCSTLKFDSVLEVQDDEKYSLSTLYTPAYGRVISSIQIKSIPTQNLLGFKANFQQISKIQKIEFTYKTPIQLQQYPVVIETQWRQNCGNQMFQMTTTLSKEYQVSNTWKTNDSYIKNILFSGSIGFRELYRGLSDAVTSVMAAVSGFSFNKEVKITMRSPQTVIILVEPNTRKTINYTAEVKKGIIPFQTVITFVDQTKGDIIFNYTATGIWEGAVIASIPETKILQSSISCQAKGNLRFL